ncbi:hypothetical protein DM860_004118 [Cuscuta australis]|uniref:Uncharacterized protein n=1 Tax=Cuscuta australis TaxID=267555 RepID=A0A328CW14_9ASTE|nr:hypothetical protein DM860_004118 [Cuscuta australis]
MEEVKNLRIRRAILIAMAARVSPFRRPQPLERIRFLSPGFSGLGLQRKFVLQLPLPLSKKKQQGPGPASSSSTSSPSQAVLPVAVAPRRTPSYPLRRRFQLFSLLDISRRTDVDQPEEGHPLYTLVRGVHDQAVQSIRDAGYGDMLTHPIQVPAYEPGVIHRRPDRRRDAPVHGRPPRRQRQNQEIEDDEYIVHHSPEVQQHRPNDDEVGPSFFTPSSLQPPFGDGATSSHCTTPAYMTTHMPSTQIPLPADIFGDFVSHLTQEDNLQGLQDHRADVARRRPQRQIRGRRCGTGSHYIVPGQYHDDESDS